MLLWLWNLQLYESDKTGLKLIASCICKSLKGAKPTFLILDFALDIVDGVRALHLQSNGLASQGLHKDLHASSQTQDQVKGGLLLDIVVSQGASILQLLASKDQPLLVRGDACEERLGKA